MMCGNGTVEYFSIVEVNHLEQVIEREGWRRKIRKLARVMTLT